MADKASRAESKCEDKENVLLSLLVVAVCRLPFSVSVRVCVV